MRTLCAVLLAIASAGAVPARGAEPLGEHQWRHRVLLLYVPAADAPALATFRERARERECGASDRDLVIGAVIGTGSGSLGGRPLAPERARLLRDVHGISADRVATVLVGKDGGVKLEVDGVARLDRVFRRIDAMPMRRQEMSQGATDPCDQD